MKYIDSEKLIAQIERRIDLICTTEGVVQRDKLQEYEALRDIGDLIASLQQEQDMGEVSDGYHTFNELYYYRMLYNAAFFNLLPKEWVHKSKRHHIGEECFGGGWFIVMANLPTGQVSNHYELKDWNLFKVPEKEFADEWDGHTPQEAAERIHKYLQQEQPLTIEKVVEQCKKFGGNPQVIRPEVDLVEEVTDKSRACCNCVNGATQYPNCFCWQHKHCNTDEPYKIPEEDWVETAKTCKEFELNARKEE